MKEGTDLGAAVHAPTPMHAEYEEEAARWRRNKTRGAGRDRAEGSAVGGRHKDTKQRANEENIYCHWQAHAATSSVPKSSAFISCPAPPSPCTVLSFSSRPLPQQSGTVEATRGNVTNSISPHRLPTTRPPQTCPTSLAQTQSF